MDIWGWKSGISQLWTNPPFWPALQVGGRVDAAYGWSENVLPPSSLGVHSTIDNWQWVNECEKEGRRQSITNWLVCHPTERSAARQQARTHRTSVSRGGRNATKGAAARPARRLTKPFSLNDCGEISKRNDWLIGVGVSWEGCETLYTMKWRWRYRCTACCTQCNIKKTDIILLA